jgi:hypothetical protein
MRDEALRQSPFLPPPAILVMTNRNAMELAKRAGPERLWPRNERVSDRQHAGDWVQSPTD